MTMYVTAPDSADGDLGFAWLSLIPALLPIAKNILGGDTPKPTAEDAIKGLQQGNPSFYTNGGSSLTPEQVQAIVNATLQNRGVGAQQSYPGGQQGGGITSTYGVQAARTNSDGSVNCPPAYYYSRGYGICYDPNVYPSEMAAKEAFTRGGGVTTPPPRTPTTVPATTKGGTKVVGVGGKSGRKTSGSVSAGKKRRGGKGIHGVDLDGLGEALSGNNKWWWVLGGLAIAAGGVLAATRASNPHGTDYLGEAS